MKRWYLVTAVVAAAAIGLSAARASLGPSRALSVGQKVVFRAGVLRTGSKISCTSHGIRIVGRVPRRGHAVAKIADGVNSGSTTLHLTTRANGSVVAVCR